MGDDKPGDEKPDVKAKIAGMSESRRKKRAEAIRRSAKQRAVDSGVQTAYVPTPEPWDPKTESESAGNAGDETPDVKDKIAGLAASRKKKREEAIRRSAKQRAVDSGVQTAYVPTPEPWDPKAESEAEEVPEILGMSQRLPGAITSSRIKVTPEPAVAEQQPEAKKVKQGPGPALVFVAGLIAGCLPGIITLAQQVGNNSTSPDLPADAVARSHDHIHCQPGDGSKWQCTIYSWGGDVLGKGEFVAAAEKAAEQHGADAWSDLASDGQLVHDGWYTAAGSSERVLYVRGIAVTAQRKNKGKNSKAGK